MADHAQRCSPEACPLLAKFKTMSMDERWVDRSPQTMLETVHWFRGEGFRPGRRGFAATPARPGRHRRGLQVAAGVGKAAARPAGPRGVADTDARVSRPRLQRGDPTRLATLAAALKARWLLVGSMVRLGKPAHPDLALSHLSSGIGCSPPVSGTWPNRPARRSSMWTGLWTKALLKAASRPCSAFDHALFDPLKSPVRAYRATVIGVLSRLPGRASSLRTSACRSPDRDRRASR